MQGFGGQPSFGLISAVDCLDSALLAVFSLFMLLEPSFGGFELELTDTWS